MRVVTVTAVVNRAWGRAGRLTVVRVKGTMVVVTVFKMVGSIFSKKSPI